MISPDTIYPDLLVIVNQHANEIRELQDLLHEACRASQSGIRDLAGHETQIVQLKADLRQVERYLHYHVEPKIDRCVELVQSLYRDHRIPAPDVPPNAVDLENQP